MPPPLLPPPDLGGGGGSRLPAASVPVGPLLRGTGTAPLSPAPASATTATHPVAAAQLPSVAGWARQASRVRSRFQTRPSAPCRIGSSTNRQDSAASPMLAAIWTAAPGRSSVALAGVVSTMTGKCHR